MHIARETDPVVSPGRLLQRSKSNSQGDTEIQKSYSLLSKMSSFQHRNYIRHEKKQGVMQTMTQIHGKK